MIRSSFRFLSRSRSPIFSQVWQSSPIPSSPSPCNPQCQQCLRVAFQGDCSTSLHVKDVRQKTSKGSREKYTFALAHTSMGLGTDPWYGSDESVEKRVYFWVPRHDLSKHALRTKGGGALSHNLGNVNLLFWWLYYQIRYFFLYSYVQRAFQLSWK